MPKQLKPLSAIEIVELKLRDALKFSEDYHLPPFIWGELGDALDALEDVKKRLSEARITTLQNS